MRIKFKPPTSFTKTKWGLNNIHGLNVVGVQSHALATFSTQKWGKMYLVTIKNWQRFIKKKGLKNPPWFGIETKFLKSPNWCELNDRCKVFFIWLQQVRCEQSPSKILVISSTILPRYINNEDMLDILLELKHFKLIDFKEFSRAEVTARSRKELAEVTARSLDIDKIRKDKKEIRLDKNCDPDKNRGTLSPTAKVRDAFQESYEEIYGYKSPWGKKENGQISNWLKSVPFDEALQIARLYPHWKDPYIADKAHPLSLMITNTAKIMSYIKNPTEHVLRVLNAKQEKTNLVNQTKGELHDAQYQHALRRLENTAKTTQQAIPNTSQGRLPQRGSEPFGNDEPESPRLE